MDYENSGITITPPALGDVTDDNASGEVTLQVGDDSQVIVSYWLTVTIAADARNKVGGVYYQNGYPVGMVYVVNDGTPGTGRAISLQQSFVFWANNKGIETGATSMTDGRANMKAMDETISSSPWNLFWHEYPAMNKARTMNDAAAVYSSGAVGLWYLPSVGEWQHLLCVATGNPLETWWFEGSDKPDSFFSPFGRNHDLANFNSLLLAVGGMGLENTYWSSVEVDTTGAWGFHVEEGSAYERSRDVSLNVRAIVAF